MDKVSCQEHRGGKLYLCCNIRIYLMDLAVINGTL